MKKNIVLAFFAAFYACTAFSQIPDSVRVDMNNISIPTSPGFILLDESPSVIERPASPKAFAASVYNSIKETGGFPTNYAVEFSPFWYFRHPKMTAYRFWGYDKAGAKQLPFAHIKKASLSLAYVNSTDTGSASSISNVAFGIRTTLVSIRSKRNIESIKEANEQVVSNLKSINLEIIALDPNQPDYPEKVKEIIDNYENDEELLRSEEALVQQIDVRPVFAIDAAFAYSTFFLNDKYADQHFGRLGVWATINYSQILGSDPLSKNYLSFYGIVRYLQDGMGRDSLQNWVRTDNLDLGGKAELELNKLSLGMEYIFRQNEAENTYRAAFMMNYRLTEAFALTASFGRNFGEEQNLITLFGLNFGINSGNEVATIK